MDMPALPVSRKSAWTAGEITDFLSRAVIPMRLAVNDTNGFPRICSLWFGVVDGHLVAVSHKKALITRLAQADNRCAFEIASNTEPYQGVRGQARVVIDSLAGQRVLPQLMEKYIGSRHPDLQDFLNRRLADEYALRLDIDWISAWDYSGRMLG